MRPIRLTSVAATAALLTAAALALVGAGCSAGSDVHGDEAAAAAAARKDPPVPAEIPLPLDAAKLLSELQARGITTKAGALAALPAQLRSHPVLVHTTGAMGKASRARPRAIVFSEDARFILASTGHPISVDRTANTVEILAFDDATMTYRASVIDFDEGGPHLSQDDFRCGHCHGVQTRPIWGAYPDWPGAYGGAQGHAGVDTLSEAERADFATFLTMARTDPDYRHLDIRPTQGGYQIPTPYGHPLTLFTARLGVRYATQLAARMARQPALPELEYALVATAAGCTEPASQRAFVDAAYQQHVAADLDASTLEVRYPAIRHATKLFRLLGVEPTTDLRIGQRFFDAPAPVWEPGMNPWNAGGDHLDDLAVFPIFERLLTTDRALADLYAAARPAIESTTRVTFAADALALGALTATSQPSYVSTVFPYLHTNVFRPAQQGDVCAHLAERQVARQAR